MVDARENKVGATVGKNVQRQFHTIDRRPVAGITFGPRKCSHAAHPKCHTRGNRSRLSRARPVGGYNTHIAQVGNTIGQKMQTFGPDAVVVGKKNARAEERI